jgi:hypothetical protein
MAQVKEHLPNKQTAMISKASTDNIHIIYYQAIYNEIVKVL